ncbi:MAG: galactonate dehydratase [Planctomycetaceae bacterium]|nr:galactonate dehydratase [Planctomycetaceae bacterium]
MKITDIQALGANLGGGNHIYVKVMTDEHLHGYGEAYRVGPDEAVAATVTYFKEWLIGEDPTRIEHLWRIMHNGSRFPGGSVINAAISGIENALWDIKGKAHGVPVYQLLGGRCRDKIRVYLGTGGATPAEAAQSAGDAVKQGFTAVKMSPFPAEAEKMPWSQVLKGAAARLEAVRRTVGENVDIGLDPHARLFEPYKALELAHTVAPYRPMFFEEPLRPENIDAMGQLKDKLPIPLATGEMLYTKYEFRDLIAARAVDILQPDLVLCGGLLETKKIAAMAEAHYLTVAPHNPLGGASTAVSTHFAASTGNFLILEYRLDTVGANKNLLKTPIRYDDGYLVIPETPGLGIEVNEEAIKNRPLRFWRRPLVLEPDGNVAYQ